MAELYELPAQWEFRERKHWPCGHCVAALFASSDCVRFRN